MSALFTAKCRGKWEPAAHDLAPFRDTDKGKVHRCTRCRFLFVDPTRISTAKPKLQNTPIRMSCRPSPAWQKLGFKPHLEAWGSAYFDALLDYCHNRQLFIGDDNFLIVCVSADRLLPLNESRDLSVISLFKVHAIDTWDEFLQTIKRGAEEVFKDTTPPPYWDHYIHNQMSAARDCGAIERMPKIDQEFEEQIGPPQPESEKKKKPWWKPWKLKRSRKKLESIPDISSEIANAFDEDVRKSLQDGHAAFIHALNTSDFELGKKQAAEALLVCPARTTWTLFAVLRGLDDEDWGPVSAVLAIAEWIDFVSLPYIARDLAFAQIGFRNRYGTVPEFFRQLDSRKELGLTDAGWSFLDEHPDLFCQVGAKIIGYADHVTKCGLSREGKLIHILGVSIRDCVKDRS